MIELFSVAFMRKFLLLILLFCCVGMSGFSQGRFEIQNRQKTDKVKFKFVNNLIIIPVDINGVTLSFLLDTGVSKPIIFNFLNVSDTLKIKNTETIYLRGLGGGESVEALKSRNNVIKIGDAVKLNQDLYAVYDANLNFAPKLGAPVHGIIGFDIFKDLVVEMNYSGKYLRLTEPDAHHYKNCKKCETFNLEFYNNKPYINAHVTVDDEKIPVKLLIDSGGSDALWLFEDKSLGIHSGDIYFNDFLGHGLSGSVYGKRGKIQSFSLKHFVFKDANVAYPDSSSISHAKVFKDRNGSVSAGILKRFNVIMDYNKAIVTFKKNNAFKSKFTYNKSGIELAHDGLKLVKERDNSMARDGSSFTRSNQSSDSNIIVLDKRYKIALKPSYTIVELRKGSPADLAGLRIGDDIISINNKLAYQYSLQSLMQLFYEDGGYHIKMKVDRDGKSMDFNFILEDIFKKKS